MYTYPKNLPKPSYPKKSENFLNAELDLINSSYKMLMYREGFSSSKYVLQQEKILCRATRQRILDVIND